MIGSGQNVQSEVELLPTNQKRVGNVLLYDVWLGLGFGPSRNGTDFVKKKDALALRLCGGLHNPNVFVSGLLEFISKNAIFEWEVKSHREEVIAFSLCSLAFLFQEFFVLFEVTTQVVLSA